jgi:hypothetical protein
MTLSELDSIIIEAEISIALTTTRGSTSLDFKIQTDNNKIPRRIP